MSWSWILTIIGGPLGTAALAWLFRRRISGSWVGRRLAAESDLATCRQELQSQAESWTRQEAGLMREIQQRERERDSIAAALKQLSDAVEVVKEARDAGVLKPSLTAPEPWRRSLSPGLTKRRVRRTAARLARRPGQSAERSNDETT